MKNIILSLSLLLLSFAAQAENITAEPSAPNETEKFDFDAYRAKLEQAEHSFMGNTYVTGLIVRDLLGMSSACGREVWVRFLNGTEAILDTYDAVQKTEAEGASDTKNSSQDAIESLINDFVRSIFDAIETVPSGPCGREGKRLAISGVEGFRRGPEMVNKFIALIKNLNEKLNAD